MTSGPQGGLQIWNTGGPPVNLLITTGVFEISGVTRSWICFSMSLITTVIALTLTLRPVASEVARGLKCPHRYSETLSSQILLHDSASSDHRLYFNSWASSCSNFWSSWNMFKRTRLALLTFSWSPYSWQCQCRESIGSFWGTACQASCLEIIGHSSLRTVEQYQP